jgi:hypothetical protein
METKHSTQQQSWARGYAQPARWLARLFLGLLVLSLAGTVQAQNYSPAFCAPADSWGNPLHSRQPSGFVNGSSSDMYVTCPIVRQNFTSTGGLWFASVTVRNPANKITTCWIYSVDGSGNTVGADQEEIRTGALTTLIFNAPPRTSTYLEGTYSLLCKLPPGGAIKNYHIDEAP